MRFRKSAVCILLLFILPILSGCGQKSTPGPGAAPALSSSEAQTTILTSFYPMYIMTVNITRGVPGVQVVNLTQPITGCLHDYQLTTDDMKKVQAAEIMVVNGAGAESFLDKVIRQQPDLRIIEASRGMALLPGSEGTNPHIWVSVAGAIQQVKNIGQQLSELDPANASVYSANTDTYVEKLEKLRSDMHQALDGAKNRDIITFHEAFPYFAQEFNLNVAAVVEREPGAEPSAGELSETIELVKRAKVKAIFVEPQYPTRAAETIARETGARVYVLDPAVTGPMEPDAYLNIMRNNLKTLNEALNQ